MDQATDVYIKRERERQERIKQNREWLNERQHIKRERKQRELAEWHEQAADRAADRELGLKVIRIGYEKLAKLCTKDERRLLRKSRKRLEAAFDERPPYIA